MNEDREKLIKSIKKFNKAVEAAKKTFDNETTIDEIKVWDHAVMDYDMYYYLRSSKYVAQNRHIVCVNEGMVAGKFAYEVCIPLIDDTEITLMVSRESWKDDFLSDNKIMVDSIECRRRIDQILEMNLPVVEMKIAPPLCSKSGDGQENIPRIMYMYGYKPNDHPKAAEFLYEISRELKQSVKEHIRYPHDSELMSFGDAEDK